MILPNQKQIQLKNHNKHNNNNNNNSKDQHNNNNLRSKEAKSKFPSNSNNNSPNNNLIARNQLLSSKCNSSSRVLLGNFISNKLKEMLASKCSMLIFDYLFTFSTERWKWNVFSAWWCNASPFALRNSNATIAAQSKMLSRKCQFTPCSFVETAKREFCLNQEVSLFLFV